MTIHHADPWLTIHGGDCRDVLATLPDASVHMVCTSPPYWGLRDYGVTGQLGLEPTPEEYVANMVAVFREVRRVLRDDGTLWLNLGDSYATGTGRNDTDAKNLASRAAKYGTGTGPGTGPRSFKGMTHPTKPKDLVGIPWRVAFALQADGWVLRSEIVWSKPNPMPESVTDRPTKSHEQLFLLSKAKRIGPEPTPWDDIADSDARWLAGVIDTEGSIIIRREAPKGDDYGSHAAQVSVGNTSVALLDEIVRIVGRGNVLERAGQNAPMHYWQASNKVALGILRRVYPFLIVKQRQARCAIALEEGKRYQGGHERISSAEVQRRDRLWQAVKSLNHFGSPDLSGIAEPVFGRWTSQPYFYDADAVAEAVVREWDESNGTIGRNRLPVELGGQRDPQTGAGVTRRNRRSVWTVATQPYPGAHFAVMPEALVEPCVLAGTSERGVCPECGAPWERVVERSADFTSGSGMSGKPPTGKNGSDYAQATSGTYDIRMGPSVRSTTTGWRPTCAHTDAPTTPGVVLDPFGGSGTVARVANRLSRRAILIDLNPDYLAQQLERNRDMPLGLTA